jgi:hypothetical protein
MGRLRSAHRAYREALEETPDKARGLPVLTLYLGLLACACAEDDRNAMDRWLTRAESLGSNVDPSAVAELAHTIRRCVQPSSSDDLKTRITTFLDQL